MALKPRESLTLVRVVFIGPLAIPQLDGRFLHTQCSILNLIAEGCWSRRQLRSSIKDVSVASKLRNSLTLVGVGFINTLAIPELDGRFLHNYYSDPECDCGRSLHSAPATLWYRIRPEAPIPH